VLCLSVNQRLDCSARENVVAAAYPLAEAESPLRIFARVLAGLDTALPRYPRARVRQEQDFLFKNQ